jgi:predicted small lipoprotein YifL
MRRVAIALLLAGCGVNNPTYFPPPSGPVENGAMGGEISATVTLPFRQPSDDERAKLDEESAARGFRVPWLRRDSVAISVQYAVTNLSDKDGTAQILVDGANEITSYDRAAIQMAAMMAAVNNQQVEVLSLITAKPFAVPAGKTVTGTVREDDFAEAELDLDAIGRWMAPPAAVLINASEVNAVGLETMPPAVVVPAMFRVAVTMTASRHMRLDFLVRVRDTKGQLIDPMIGGDPFAPMPAGYMPPAMMP